MNPFLKEKTNSPHPSWIRGVLSLGKNTKIVGSMLEEFSVKSVCVASACPNKGKCWEAKHVTFMILGEICTRNCKFCNVSKARPVEPDEREPENIAKAVKELGIKYAVITSVTRDDLKDRGKTQFVKTVKAVKKISHSTMTELLIPDMDSDPLLLKDIALSGAEVLSHNIEIPENFYKHVRSKACYRTSLKTLEILKKYCGSKVPVKTSMIVGMGEVFGDIIRTFGDLKKTGVDILYVGQYLSPSKKHWPVKKYYTPEEFESLRQEAVRVGFKVVYSGPLVRSSYGAYDAYKLYNALARSS